MSPVLVPEVARHAPASLAQAMRDGSADAHRAAESSDFVTRLVAGRLGAGDYLAYLEALRTVYAELERLVEHHCDDPAVAAVADPRLLRSRALDSDVAHWRERAGSERSAARPGAAVTAYVDRLRDASDRPWLLVAHHYTRYLGDLSGGRILARHLADAFGPAGLDFYAFDRIGSPVRFKRDYRERLDALDLDDAQRGALVAEVRAAFDCNRALLAALG